MGRFVSTHNLSGVCRVRGCVCEIMALTRSSVARDLIPHPWRERDVLNSWTFLHNCCAADSFCSNMEAWLDVKGRLKLTQTETSSLPVSPQPLRVKSYLRHHTGSSGWVCSAMSDGLLQLSSACLARWMFSHSERLFLISIPGRGRQTIGTSAQLKDVQPTKLLDAPS